MHVAAEEWIKLNHYQRRCLVNKWRRSWRRKQAAEAREKAQAVLESQPGYLQRLAEEELRTEEEGRRRDAQARLEHDAWLQREKVAQQEHRTRVEREEKILREREERERVIKEEWEALQRREREEQERRDSARREKEERLKEALSTGDKPAHDPWHNPPAPADSDSSRLDGQTSSLDYGTERDMRHCSFFLKTGACRFGERCSRLHPRVSSSTTLLVPGMYQDPGLQTILLDERGQDAALEYDERERYQHFKQFFDDTLPEFAKAGKVVQFKVSCNYESHLRGNVYVQYSSKEECSQAHQLFNGRWYAQKQLSCQFCPVERWRSAICGLFANMQRCPKGKHCNFLHVFRNPGGAFSRADRDLPPSPHPSHPSPPSQPRRRQSSSGWSSRRGSWHRSRSWERFQTSRRSRSRSRERRRRLSGSRSPRRRRSKSRSPRQRRRRSHSRSSSQGEKEKEEDEEEGKRKRQSSHHKKHGKKRRSRSRNRSSSKKHKKKKRSHHHHHQESDREIEPHSKQLQQDRNNSSATNEKALASLAGSHPRSMQEESGGLEGIGRDSAGV